MLKFIGKPLFVLSVTMLLGMEVMAQVTTPRPSPAAELTQTIGLTRVTINYSRPSVKRGNNDRTGQIWGIQVPWGLATNGFGNQKPMPWRAGANENTIISFSTPIWVEGKKIESGSYGLHMIPEESGKVTVIFSTNTSSWGSFWYDPSEDALRVVVQMQDAPFTNVLTYEFTELSTTTGTLALFWEKKQIPIKLSANQEIILAGIRDELRGVTGFGWQGPLSAANYCLNNNTNHEEALQWVDRAIAGNKSGQTLGVKAALLFQKGDNEEAVKIADEAKEIATINELNALGYQLMGANQMDKAEEFFLLNIKRNPKVANCYDSMGECYVTMGKNDEAIKMFKKSLSMNPPANVKANSILNLKKLGVAVAE